MSVSVDFLAQWIMPLFFLLSGLSVYYSLSRRTRGQFVRGRFKRLAIPFLFGTFVARIPLQVYIECVSRSQFAGSFIEFYPHYFDSFYAFKRLAIPFLFGTFVVLIPLQVYIERVSHSQFAGSFIEFYPGVMKTLHIWASSTSQNLAIFVPFCHPVLNRQEISGVLNTACFTNINRRSPFVRYLHQILNETKTGSVQCIGFISPIMNPTYQSDSFTV